MRSLIFYFLYGCLRLLLSLRYTIEVKGLKEIKASKKQGILFLPNHPAEIDPVILIRVLWPSFKPKPLAVEYFYYQKGIRFFMELVNAIPIPTMDMGNPWKAKRIEKLKKRIVSGLDKKESFLIYPSGKLKLTADERLGAASLASDLLNMKPDANVVLIRTTGLWGSSFSRALTGASPDFRVIFWDGVKTILKNGIFFAPRRHVTVELEWAPEAMPRQAEKMELNQWLENWYNTPKPEELTLVSRALWKKDFPEVKKKEEVADQQHIAIPEEQKVQILGHIAKLTGKDISEITLEQHLANDLGLDSLDVSQLYIFLEERFNIFGLAPGQLQTVGDMMEAASGVKKEIAPSHTVKKSKWPPDDNRPAPLIPEGETIQEVFLRACDRMGESTCCADSLSGVLSYKKFKRGALVLSEKIKTLPGDSIGVLLPASVAAYLTILAVQMAGKTPVMLNWTAGYRNLEHAAKICDLKTVISSFRFLSRLETSDLGEVDDLLHLLEEERRQISFGMKLKGLFLSFLKADSLIKKIKKTKTAVVIFTSGTETLPKGVPLTHQNVLSNLRAALSCIQLKENDLLYGVLPPFHSFGFTVTGIFPLIAGVKVCFAPDPTDSRALANDIEHWKPTIFCCAPSFITAMLRVSKEGGLNSLRLIVTGAEKAPQELFDVIQSKGKTLLEGYGISECSPIVTIDREGEPHKGVGKPIPNVELKIIDAETNSPLPNEKEGEICIHGPSVFDGYLGVPTDPFIEMDGKKWYKSGDRGVLEQDGTLVITGRLKRFVKIGAEMISLGGLEEEVEQIALDQKWLPNKPEGKTFAVVASGSESEKPQMILFSTIDLDRDELNKQLRERGQSRLVKIHEVRKLNEIPLTGTGKTHYRLLDELL